VVLPYVSMAENPWSPSSGGSHTCGLTSAGRAYCWGLNSLGQLGDGTTTDRGSATPVAGDLTFANMAAAGWLHSCGVTTAGHAYCWGQNGDGQLGDGTTIGRLVPTRTAAWDGG
jgi:alpha-tubulin suppressor-like RCC1 family protein